MRATNEHGTVKITDKNCNNFKAIYKFLTEYFIFAPLSACMT